MAQGRKTPIGGYQQSMRTWKKKMGKWMNCLSPKRTYKTQFEFGDT